MTAELISYRHRNEPKSGPHAGQRFVQSAAEPLPAWAVDVQPYKESETMLKLPTSGPWTGEQVAAARAALGLTQAELADALELGGGVNAKDSVRNWERNKRPITGPARVAIRFMVERAGVVLPSGPKLRAVNEPKMKAPVT